MQRGKIFAQVLVIGMLALGSQLLTAGRAAAYDFRICSNFGAVYIHVHTVSALCHDRTPVDYSDKPLTAIGGCVRGTTAPGCLIDGITIVPYYATIPRKEYSWGGIGVARGTWNLKQYVFGDPFVCFDGFSDQCP